VNPLSEPAQRLTFGGGTCADLFAQLSLWCHEHPDAMPVMVHAQLLDPRHTEPGETMQLSVWVEQ